MKTKIKFLLLFTIFFMQNSFAQIFKRTEVVGNNNVVTQEITTQKYEKVNVSGSIDIELIEGKEGDIEIEAEENLIEYIEVYCKNNKLTVKIRDNVKIVTNKQIKVQIPIEDLSEITLAGISTIIGRGTFEMQELEINIAGSGEMSIAVNAQKLLLNVAGSGSLNIKGNTNYCNINVAGSGNLQGENLVCEEVVAKVAGSGDSYFTCTGTLKAYVVGSGGIQYKGNPEILESKIIGSGNINKI